MGPGPVRPRTDGMGRSESRAPSAPFRSHPSALALATLYQIKKNKEMRCQCVANAVKDLGIDPEKSLGSVCVT